LHFFAFSREEVLLIDRVAPLGKDPLHFSGEGLVEAQRGDALGGELGGLSQRAFDGDLPVAEFLVVEDLGFEAVDRLFAGVVEDVVRKLDDGFQQVVLDEVLADVAGTAAGIPG
jgi:hypothetical protein